MPAMSVVIHAPLVRTYAQDNGEEIRCLQTGVTKKPLCMEHTVQPL